MSCLLSFNFLTTGRGWVGSWVAFFFGGGGEWHKRKNLQIADVQRLASLPVGVSETQPSKTKTSEPKKLRFALLRNLRPRKTQTPSYHKTSDPKKLRPLVSQKLLPQKTRTPLYHETADPSKTQMLLYHENSVS